MMRIMILVLLFLLIALPACAHFGMVLPSDDIVSASDSKVLKLEVSFLHPFEQTYMDMARPRAFGVFHDGTKDDLSSALKERRVQGKRTWHAEYRIRRPGTYMLFMEPEPYWEPAEGKFIIHYTKVMVDAMGLEKGWDAMAGLPVEIEPLSRPFGLWEGNIFRGIVKKDGRGVPFAEVEVEYLNSDRAVRAPDDAFITQVIKADVNGVFSYAMPRAGWWGFAALVEASYKLKHDGKDHPVELGGVIWVRAHQMEGH